MARLTREAGGSARILARVGARLLKARNAGAAAAKLPAKRPEVRLCRPGYAGRHAGATILVLGNGPSLADHEEPLRALIERTRPLVLGANNITPFVYPDYHAFTNRKRFAQFAHTIDPERSRVLLGAHLSPELVRAYYPGPYETLQYVRDNHPPFDIVDGVVSTGCRTVSVLMIAVAIVMGAERILVAGLDGYAHLLSTGDSAHAARMHFTPSSHERWRRDTFLEAETVTRRFLAEIQAYLAQNGREPFAIVTPTQYGEYYQPNLLEG